MILNMLILNKVFFLGGEEVGYYANFFNHCVTKGRHFVKRVYPAECLGETFLKVSQVSRDSLLKPIVSTKKTDAPNILVTTYTGFLGLKKVVSKNWDLLKPIFH